MIQFIYLQRRRLFAVWLALVLPMLTCACIGTIPEDVETSRVILWFFLYFLYKLTWALGIVLVIWLQPVARYFVDMFLPIFFVFPVVKLTATALALPRSLELALALLALGAVLSIGLGYKGIGRRFRIAYRGTGKTVLPGTPESLWPRLALGYGPVSDFAAANLVGHTKDPNDPTRMQIESASLMGALVQTDILNLQQTYPASLSYDYVIRQKQLDGRFRCGRFSMVLAARGSEETEVTAHMSTEPTPFIEAMSNWLDDKAQDSTEAVRDIVLGRPPRSASGREARRFMRAYLKKQAP